MSLKFFWCLLVKNLTLCFLEDIFKFDSNYRENEDRYKSIKAEILGEDSDAESGSGSDEEDDSEEEEGD